MIKLRRYGESALIIDFDQSEPQSRFLDIYSTKQKIELALSNDILACVPGMKDLTVVFKSESTSYENLSAKLREIDQDSEVFEESFRMLEIPICYHEEFGIDLPLLSEEKNLAIKDIIELHLAGHYQVFMMGFLPGFPYLNGLDKRLTTNRLNNSRESISLGSVAIANEQSAIYPKNSPGGWKIVGRTPIDLLRQNPNDSLLFRAGDRIRFKAISKLDFNSIRTKELVGEFDIESLYIES